MRRISLALLIALFLPALAVGASKDTKLTLVAYSTPKDAYGQLIPAFQKTAAGNGVTFSQSYGASGDQSRAVAAGLNADIVAFSLEPDITSLVQKNLVAKSWNKDKYKGMVTRSVVVFIVRDGNPKKLKTWNDLLKPGVQVITPNPFTSGGARWNVMAAYGGALRSGKTPKQAVHYLGKLWKHVVAQPTSAREGLQTFLAGRGDVFLAYENEAVFAQKHGQPVQFVIPKATILIENPIAVTSNSTHKAEANSFVKFLHTLPAQKIFAQNGYRPVVAAAARGLNFPVRPQLFTIKYVGGWPKVEKKFFDPKTGIMARFQGSSGG
ncbi:MAG: sulfate/thiosulfate transport system substrate-binding protein [Gaiellaceae bacterium]|nr:sulfate/thiosulfate transport system substrate-binding protein [Gaiellaceae bacterium]